MNHFETNDQPRGYFKLRSMFKYKFDSIGGIKEEKKLADLTKVCIKATRKYPPEYFAELIVSKWRKGKNIIRLFPLVNYSRFLAYIVNIKDINKLVSSHNITTYIIRSSKDMNRITPNVRIAPIGF